MRRATMSNGTLSLRSAKASEWSYKWNRWKGYHCVSEQGWSPQLAVTRVFNINTEQSSTWESTSRSATQELPNVLWNQKVHYRAKKARHSYPSSTRWIQYIPSCSTSLWTILILSSHLSLGLSNDLFLSDFPTKTLKLAIVSCVLHALPISSSLTWPLWL
jgi:hypothetical protein